MTKKKWGQILCAVVSVCSLVSVLSSVRAILQAHTQGTAFPVSMIIMSLVTVACTVCIWSGTRKMED